MKDTLRRGFAIIEILVAITILSIAMLAIISGVSGGIIAISENRNRTLALIIAESKLNEFVLYRRRGSDVRDEPVKEYPGFSYDRIIKRYEHALFGPVDAKKVEIIIKWKERGRPRTYTLSNVYSEK
ncbi:MAG TPA: prepilin-type N-terminal cleavage/methylation domain-containing protein [Spirochaetes bacterium]|nr:prepilin-type N-terminal cleavage/methylation domain-containing protein [Spirochaetota bacterium]